MLFPGAGGYWWRLVHRDTLAAAFKRTRHRGPPQREVLQLAGQGVARRLPARLRPGRHAGRRRRLGAAAGRAAVREAGGAGPDRLPREFDEQADRADRTWGRYQRWELSPKVREYQERFRAMQAQRGGGGEEAAGRVEWQSYSLPSGGIVVETLSLYAVVGEDRKITIRLPTSIPPGPVEIVVVVRASENQPTKLSDYRGLGKEIWEGVDAQEYVNKLRRGEES